MLDLYVSIGNTLSALEASLRVAISNADNFNSPGYKYSYTSFSTVFNRVLSSGMVINPTTSTNPISIGASMTLGSTGTDFRQGNLGLGTALDVAVSGIGFLIMSQSAVDFGPGTPQVFTRNGRFQKDFANHFITDSFGRKVYGFKLDANGNQADNNLVPIETGGNADVGFTNGGVLVGNFQAHQDAITNNTPNPPAQIPLYRLALTNFENNQGLIIVDGGAYKNSFAAGNPLPPGTSGDSNFGTIIPNSVEASNIDVARVALDMALLTRGFSAVQGIVDDVNKVINNTVSKLSG